MSDKPNIGISELKARWGEILDRLARRELVRVVVTKRGKPVAVLTPPQPDLEAVRGLHGFMRGSVIIPPDVDLTAPIWGEAFGSDTRDSEQG